MLGLTGCACWIEGLQIVQIMFAADAWGSVCLTGCCFCSNAKQELICETINHSRRSYVNLEEALQNAASEALLSRKQDTWQDVRPKTHVLVPQLPYARWLT